MVNPDKIGDLPSPERDFAKLNLTLNKNPNSGWTLVNFSTKIIGLYDIETYHFYLGIWANSVLRDRRVAHSHVRLRVGGKVRVYKNS